MTLIAFLAWVGLGADGLSSSAYGPEEAFRALGQHTYLAGRPRPRHGADRAHYLRLLQRHHRAVSHRRRRLRRGLPPAGAEHRRRLRRVPWWSTTCSPSPSPSPRAAMPSSASCRLSLEFWKLPAEYAAIILLIGLNLRGRQGVGAGLCCPCSWSSSPPTPCSSAGRSSPIWVRSPQVTHHLSEGYHSGLQTLGGLGMIMLLLRAYALGGGTYTGIEAVSNGLQIMREPRVATGKKTMVYMALSLALTAGGILIGYLLLNVQHSPGKTMNAVLAETAFGSWHLGAMPVGLLAGAGDADFGRAAAVRGGAGGLHRRPPGDGQHGRGLLSPAPLRRPLRAALDAERPSC